VRTVKTLPSVLMATDYLLYQAD